MADANVKAMNPADLCRLLNSTTLGPVLTQRRLNLHRDRAGLRIGAPRTVNLIRYAAWLVLERHKPKSIEGPTGDYYEVNKEAANLRMSLESLKHRDIGQLPAVVNAGRKDAARRDFRRFCDDYFPHTFDLPWSEDHLRVIGQMETSVLEGGLFATAMPRGSGKTTLSEIGCIWAILYGHRNFVALIGSDEGHAEQMLNSIKTELESSPLLLEDFPEAVYPIARLEGIANRCNGQLYMGRRTHIGWTSKELVMPTIPGSQASGAIVKVAGITGGIRGMKFKRADGRTVRPSLVIVDDAQTDESARSPSQCRTREEILAGAILGLSGPGKKISGIMPCTVIRPGDLSDSILNREKHPDWNGTRTKMVYSFPTNIKLWEEYGRIRAESLRMEHGGREATQFYVEHREEMDAGAAVGWPARFNYDEVSAIQHAMNLKLRDERAFFAEYQNDPMPEEEARTDDLVADHVMGRINRMERGRVPISCTHVTAFIDIHAAVHYFVVMAWEENFTGYLIDYGTFPDQHRPYFTLNDATRTLSSLIQGAGLEGQVYAGLEFLSNALLSREWVRDDGVTMKVERCLVDGNWGVSTDVVYKACRQSEHAAVLTPSHGKYIGASSNPMSEWTKRPGDRMGLNWVLRNVQGRRQVRSVVFDTNYWKTFIHARLTTAIGDNGSISLFGSKPHDHRCLADHVCAEYRVQTQNKGSGRRVDEWKRRPECVDNHWFDCLVGACVAASMCGVTLAEVAAVAPSKKARVSFAELQRRRMTQASSPAPAHQA